MTLFSTGFISGLRQRLAGHPIYQSLQDLDDLRVFMAHHAHSVWDFMSLIKCLQHTVAPARWPWIPGTDASLARFINELVLEEECHQAAPGQEREFTSHFELYLAAMREIGADTHPIENFVARVGEHGIDAALATTESPEAALRFTRTTFALLRDGRPHVVAATLAFGREHVIPEMFRRFLAGLGIGADRAPTFHYYLSRHIHLDEDFHAPLSLRLVESLCAGDPVRLEEARMAALHAVEARIEFWDGVHAAILQNPSTQSHKTPDTCLN